MSEFKNIQSAPVGSTGEPGFFAKLFDTTFNEFITPSIVRVAYIIVIICDVLISLAILFAPSDEDFSPILRLIVAVVFFFFFLIWYRLILEVFMVLHRIERHTRDMARRDRG